MLLVFAPVMLDFMEGVLEVAGFKRIELSFGLADFTDQDLEVGRLGVALDEGGKSKFLDWHRIPPTASIAKVQFSVGNSWSQLKKPVEKRTVKNLVHRPGMARHGPVIANSPGRGVA